MRNGTVVNITPNTGPPVTQVWAFVSRDAEGRENVIASVLGSLGSTPMMTGNPKTFELFKQLVADVRKDLEAGGQTIHLLHFTGRTEITEW